MKNIGIGQFKSINAFVDDKLRALCHSPNGVSYALMFELMFRERENVMYERSAGFRIERTTYGEAKEQIARRAAALNDLLGEREPNAVVGLSMDNSLDWIENFWAILMLGCRPLLINLRLSDDAVREALGDVQAVAVISDRRTYPVKTVMNADVVPASSAFVPAEFGGEILVMSSGTSAHVKVCAYSAEELAAQIVNSAQIIHTCKALKKHYDGALKQLCFLPFYHVFGLIAVYIWFAFFSRTFVELGDMDPATIVNTVKRHKVTHIFAVPLFWEKVYEQAMKTIRSRGEATARKFEKAMRISDRLGDSAAGRLFSKLAFKEVRENLFGESISFLITGGSAISPDAVRFFNAIGYPLSNGYGMTEIGITSVELSGKKSRRNSLSVGMPMQYIEYTINDEGELLVRGRALAKYIIEDGEKKPRSDDWFNTRDLASFNGKGYYILGRRDDLVVAASGENLNPGMIEPKLAVEGSAGACLIAAAVNGHTVPVLLVSVNRHTSPEALRAIDARIKERLRELNVLPLIGAVSYIGEPLLKGDEFKLNRIRLRREFEQGTLTPLARDKGDDVNDELMDSLRTAFALARGTTPDEVYPDADFFLDLGGTSLDYFAMISRLEEEFSLPFPTEEGKSLNTPREFYNYIQKNS